MLQLLAPSLASPSHRSPTMRVSLCLAFFAQAAATPQAQPELLQQLQQLQAELSQQRQVIQELQETRRLQAEESETWCKNVLKSLKCPKKVGGPEMTI